MTIVQRFLDMMGSHLEVESEYGKGSVFSFELAQKVVKWEPIGDFEEAFRRSLIEQANYHEKFTAPEARVLVVDDTPVNLTVFVNLLKRTGLQIDTDAGLSYCGDGESYMDALLVYLASVEKKADEIEQCRSANDIRNLTIKIHTLKSTSRAIGAVQLADFAQRLENAGKNEDPETLDRELPGFLSRYRQLGKDLAPLKDYE